MAAYSPFLSCGVGGRAASLYALLTGFHASDHPSMRLSPVGPSAGRTVRLAGVFAGVGVFRHERVVFLVREAWCWDVSCGRVR